ncbi:MAG: hypothetical protein K6G07_02200 [Lachnospiraceae bacterium]|nr:hypothetical protein [Lachnospiraceae bacterium]
MEDEIVRVSSASYAKYKELLIERDEVTKDAFQAEHEYFRVFGELIVDIFRQKVESIRLKKSIEYCRRFKNRGEKVNLKEMQIYLQKEIDEYQKKLDQMAQDYEETKKSEKVSKMEMMEIKRIYRRMVKKIHPDINPLTIRDENLFALWNRLVIAYNCNDLKELKELEVLIEMALEGLDGEGGEVDIPDIEEKIAEIEAEIEMIKSKEPYLYRGLLQDPILMEEKKEELRQELKEYKDYCEELQKTLDELIV